MSKHNKTQAKPANPNPSSPNVSSPVVPQAKQTGQSAVHLSHQYTITPRDTILLRDGRPLDSNVSSTGNLPYPSTIAGFCRTRLGWNHANNQFDVEPTKLSELKNVPVRGPLLMRVQTHAEQSSSQPTSNDLLLPAARDAVLLEDAQAQNAQLYCLQRQAQQENLCSDLDGQYDLLTLPANSIKGKPKTLPRYWNWSSYQKWLSNPTACKRSNDIQGLRELGADTRTSVTLNENRTSKEGRLYQAHHTSLLVNTDHKNKLEEFALWMQADCPQDKVKNIKDGIYPFASSRRLVHLQASQPILPNLPDELLKNIQQQRAARIILLTPAFFEKGWRPLDTTLAAGIEALKDKIHLRAAIVDRALGIGGWDLETSQPKPTRNAVPAGSVYYVKLPEAEDTSDKVIAAWVKNLWFSQCLNDEPICSAQDSKDGFGWCVVGVDPSPNCH